MERNAVSRRLQISPPAKQKMTTSAARVVDARIVSQSPEVKKAMPTPIKASITKLQTKWDQR